MTPIPEQIAERLARKCAGDLCKSIVVERHQLSCDEWIAAFSHSKAKDQILQSIPLVELLACYEFIKRGNRNLVEYNCKCSFCVSVAALDLKLKQLLEEEKE